MTARGFVVGFVFVSVFDVNLRKKLYRRINGRRVIECKYIHNNIAYCTTSTIFVRYAQQLVLKSYKYYTIRLVQRKYTVLYQYMESISEPHTVLTFL